MTRKGLLRNRFNKSIDKEVESFVSSISFDWRLYKEDIAGSIAHVEMLAKKEIINEADCDKIVGGLLAIKEEIETGKFQFSVENEDIHMNIEARLFEIIGDTAAKLHTARSRNDQIALDIRLFMKDALAEQFLLIKNLQKSLVLAADKNLKVIMPGFTHLQHAQPILFSHYLMAYYEMLQRDIERLNDCFKRVDVMPLGSGALGGVNYSIDRKFVAKRLGFSEISKNSLDAVSDRDFIIEYESCAAMLIMHLSRLAEELIIWSTTEFDFIEIDDSYCTSSSIMPQKKNPDVLEIIRGKSGSVYGGLIGMLTVMKGLPLAYNRDMQEDKESLFNILDTVNDCLELMSGIIDTLKIKDKKMYQTTGKNYILATDIADYLVKKGVSFREAHSITAKMVGYAVKKNKEFFELKLKEYKQFSPYFEDDVFKINLEKSVASRDNQGGTAPRQVKLAIKKAKTMLNL
jgi:argininosuccinate lyase